MHVRDKRVACFCIGMCIGIAGDSSRAKTKLVWGCLLRETRLHGSLDATDCRGKVCDGAFLVLSLEQSGLLVLFRKTRRSNIFWSLVLNSLRHKGAKVTIQDNLFKHF